MTRVRVQEAASWRLDDIYRYTRDRWGEAQATRDLNGLFEAFDRIEAHGVASKPVPAAFGIEGFFFRDERHFVYWKRLPKGDIGIVTILHERMHQIAGFKSDFFGDEPSPEEPKEDLS
jgi:toxin ParE1/3/4